MSVHGITADNAPNHPDIEKQWAVHALHHAETYMNLIKKVDGKLLRLTTLDDELYRDFRATFPQLAVDRLDELGEFKSAQAKEAWRAFIQRYETKIEDYNFGTLIRVNALEDLGEHNSMFVTRVQFLAIEVARNREGLNSKFYVAQRSA